jgi:hypothetical protein
MIIRDNLEIALIENNNYSTQTWNPSKLLADYYS